MSKILPIFPTSRHFYKFKNNWKRQAKDISRKKICSEKTARKALFYLPPVNRETSLINWTALQAGTTNPFDLA